MTVASLVFDSSQRQMGHLNISSSVVQNPNDMSNVKPNGKTRKLSEGSHAEMGKLLAKFPNIAKVIEDPENADMLENLLRSTHILKIEQEVSIKLKEFVQRMDCLAVMREIVSKRPPSEHLRQFTAKRMMRDHPNLRDHFLNFMGNAIGYDDLLRQLMTHHNFESLEPGDINDIIYQVEELRTAFRDMAVIQASQYRAPGGEDEVLPNEGKAA